MKLKSTIRQTPLYNVAIPVLGLLLDWKIRSEQQEYENRGKSLGLSLELEHPRDTFKRMIDRLSTRGIQWPPQAQGRPFHFVSVSIPAKWELHNIPPQVETLGEVTYYYIKERVHYHPDKPEKSRRDVDADLLEFVEDLHRRHPVDMMLSYLSGVLVSPETIKAIGELGIVTFNFNLDDRAGFRGKKYNGLWSGAADVCPAFDLNLTSCPDSIVKYRVEGAEAIFWPEGANPYHFKPLPLEFDFDVTFVGQRYGKRPRFINKLRRSGIKVECFGDGWENGRLSEKEMVQVYARSRINLGFGYISRGSEQCLKGRDFEVPSCGALYLTSHNRYLDMVYRVGEEIETYRTQQDAIIKIKELLADPERCDKIRHAAREACLRRHTWALRVGALLRCTGEFDYVSPA